MREINTYLDKFFNCSEHSNKRECLEGIIEDAMMEGARQYQDKITSMVQTSKHWEDFQYKLKNN